MSLHLGKNEIPGVKVGASVDNPVTYDKQSPTQTQQAQVRENIDVMGTEEVNQLISRKADRFKFIKTETIGSTVSDQYVMKFDRPLVAFRALFQLPESIANEVVSFAFTGTHDRKNMTFYLSLRDDVLKQKGAFVDITSRFTDEVWRTELSVVKLPVTPAAGYPGVFYTTVVKPKIPVDRTDTLYMTLYKGELPSGTVVTVYGEEAEV